MMENQNNTVEEVVSNDGIQEGAVMYQETQEAPTKPEPLKVRVMFYQGEPLEFTINDMYQGQFRVWIAQHVASQLGQVGIFIGNVFIQNSRIKFFEEI